MSDQQIQDDNQINPEELAVKCQEYLSGWKRALADYENLKRENDRKVQEILEFSTMAMAAELLAIYDHYKLALLHLPQEQQQTGWGEGIFHIKREFEDFLKRLEITEIKTVGEEFNPNFHEAVSTEESTALDNTVIKEVSAGYLMKGRVIRPAKVIVSSQSKNIINDAAEPASEGSAASL